MMQEKSKKSTIVVAGWKPAGSEDIQMCAVCGRDFVGVWGDEPLCEECSRFESGTIHTWR